MFKQNWIINGINDKSDDNTKNMFKNVIDARIAYERLQYCYLHYNDNFCHTEKLVKTKPGCGNYAYLYDGTYFIRDKLWE